MAQVRPKAEPIVGFHSVQAFLLLELAGTQFRQPNAAALLAHVQHHPARPD